MKRIKALVILLAALVLTSCFEDRDDNIVESSSINDFVWKAMNLVYLYKSEIPNLADDRFGSNAEYSEYLNGFSSPEALFESLIYQRETVDRFSIIVDDYITLEQRLQGIFKTNGMEFALYAAPNSDTELVGVVRLVLNGSEADIKGVKRGDLFAQVDGTTITRTNAGSLLNQDVYTINLGTYNDKGTTETSDDSIEPNGTNIVLEKFQFTENPIHISKTFQVGGENVGYVMYNGFTAGSENSLNNVFANFKSSNVQHLVLDLRYNPGGSVTTTTFLASMITGQFTGQVFEKLVYNENLQELNFDYLFTSNINGSAINSLNLSKIYVLTTDRSASASEGLINGLKPYIEVVQVGINTTGKTQASRVFYDSADFGRQGANPAHTYAIQPLIANGINKNLEAVPGTGLPPSIGFEYEERPLNLGVLGDENEPMLALALADIENSTTKRNIVKEQPQLITNKTMDSFDFLPFEKGGMIVD
ncbi:S41 family peptidase [Jejuia pallidilutea]|uniref:Carboxyl-terminal protease n=1 Tax=Jejuia pallidilutea TaxID=504487 RepID=A0A090VW96_9FLAO|nr:S41 family peptidase [Jejuia pallidilutea]GAL67539.1 carboxyl-terminal protease [Jejuia pallidilutea]GAL71342.1 carboxyl-terminal protease [Jejuia pallidilutea]GAL89372.1 carboxyl-terminal protease [Jejuia pallidilutea]